MQEALLQAIVFVYDLDGKVLGFIGLMNEYDILSLSVYQQIYGQLLSIIGRDFQSCQKELMKIRAKKNIRCYGKTSYDTAYTGQLSLIGRNYS